MITHGAPGDTFWDIIRKGAEAAAAKDNVKFQYSSDPDSGKQATLIQSAIDAKVDGIAVTLPDPPALAPAVKKAVDAGIPVVAFNAGIGAYQQSGALSYFGSDESLAGETAGKRASDDGYKNLLCVIQEQGQVQLEARCDGVKKTFTGKWSKLYVNGRDAPSVKSTMGAKLAQDKSIDLVVTLGAQFALNAIDAIKEGGSKAKVGTFDFNPQIPPKINSGELQFAIDQQPYLQGYLAGRLAVALQEQRQRPRRRQPTLTGRFWSTRATSTSSASSRRAAPASHRHGGSPAGGPPCGPSLGGSHESDSGRRHPASPGPGRAGRATLDARRLLARPRSGRWPARSSSSPSSSSSHPPFRELSSLSHGPLRELHLRHPGGRGGAAHDRREFDLSAGVAVTASALVASMVAYQFSANMFVGVLVALVVALLIGFINGYLVVKTGIPSFLVTLGTFFMIRGLNLAVTKIVTGNVGTNDVSDIAGFETAKSIFASSFTVGGVQIRITLLWWIVFVLIATWVLLRTHVGNWIFAVGGSAASSRAVGVPVNKVKIGLFMTVGFMCWFTGMHILFAFNTVQSGIGLGNEFIYIVAAVVGGCLLTGGYGSVIGPPSGRSSSA
jgi:ABC-type sugar transport system substrate-binding protein/branched-subunit amino acid ABC-type transport system permease component